MSDIFCHLAPKIENFSTIRIIGQGSFGKVYLVRPKDADANSAEVYAMKVLQKSEVIRRHQVEHTITEEITGVDIVRSQIEIAQGYPLDDPRIYIKSQRERYKSEDL